MREAEGCWIQQISLYLAMIEKELISPCPCYSSKHKIGLGWLIYEMHHVYNSLDCILAEALIREHVALVHVEAPCVALYETAETG